MPLTDRDEFRAWLHRRNEDAQGIGQRHNLQGDPLTGCTFCGNPVDPKLGSEQCLICLAEHFGIDTVQTWLAEIVAGFINAAADPNALAEIIAELIQQGRNLAQQHLPPTTLA